MIDIRHIDDVVEHYGRRLGEEGADTREVLGEAFRAITARHAEYLESVGPIRAFALDPCPRCTGQVIASDTVAKCAAGCGWEYPRCAS